MNVTVDPQKPKAQAPLAPKKRSYAWVWILLLVIAAVAVFFVVRSSRKEEEPAAGRPAGGPGGFGGRGGFMRMPTTVAAEPAHHGDLPDYIVALGTVTALNTAVVHSRVDGQLMKVNFEEGQEVKEGDVLAEIDPRPFETALQQAQGQLARDRAFLENARADLKRYQSAQEAVTQQQIDSAKAAVAQYEGAVKSDEGSVANYTLQLSFCHVTAPISGRVGLRQVDAGNLVRSSDANGIVVITQIQPIAVRFSIPEDALPSVSKALISGQSLSIEVFDRSMKKGLAQGTVAAIDNQIDTTTGTVRLKAVVPNEDLALFPNQFVNVRLLLRVEKDVVLIPTSAIQLNGPDRFVYVVNTEGTVERRNVKVGNAEGLYTVALDGIKEGEVVVTEGLDRLQNGSKVTARLPGTAPAITPTPGGAEKGAAGAGDKAERRRRWKQQGGSGQKGP